MKVLCICAIGITARKLLKPQIDYLRSRQLDVEIACSPDADADQLRQEGYTVHPVQIDRKISPISNLKSIYQLANLMWQNHYDLVHVHTPIAGVLGRIAAKLAGIPAVIYTAHGFPFHQHTPFWQYFFYFAIEKFSALLTDQILTQSYEDYITARKQGLCSANKVQHLNNGVDVELFNRDRLDPIKQSYLRQSLGIPETAKLVIGTVGRLNRQKGSGYLIEAAHHLLLDFPELHIMVIGSQLSTDRDPFQQELLQLIETLGLTDRVTFTGFRDDVPELLGLLDIFTLPTFFGEGLPRSILEAMAMSLPVVTTDIRGCREAVIHEKTGLIVPPKNSEKLEEALRCLIVHPKLRQSYGQAGRQRVQTEFDEQFVFQRLAKVYQELGVTFP